MDKAGLGVILGLLFFGLAIAGIVTKSVLLITLAVISLVLMFIIAVKENEEMKVKAKNDMDKTLKSNHFNPDKSRLSFDYLKAISLNEDGQKIAYLSRSNINKNFTLKEFKFNEIIEAKIIKNNETITSTSIESTVGRAAVGGLLFGGIGAIVSGMGASKTSSEQIRELTLEIIVDDILNPRYTFTFYKGNSPLDQNSEKFKKVVEDVEGWYRSMTVIINRNEKVRSV